MTDPQGCLYVKAPDGTLIPLRGPRGPQGPGAIVNEGPDPTPPVDLDPGEFWWVNDGISPLAYAYEDYDLFPDIMPGELTWTVDTNAPLYNPGFSIVPDSGDLLLQVTAAPYEHPGGESMFAQVYRLSAPLPFTLGDFDSYTLLKSRARGWYNQSTDPGPAPNGTLYPRMSMYLMAQKSDGSGYYELVPYYITRAAEKKDEWDTFLLETKNYEGDFRVQNPATTPLRLEFSVGWPFANTGDPAFTVPPLNIRIGLLQAMAWRMPLPQFEDWR